MMSMCGQRSRTCRARANPASAPPGYTEKSAPGFRYNIVSDCAVTLPEVLPAPAVSVTYPGGLPAYPFYAYHDPGVPLFPRDWLAPALVVADAVRAHCDFELALKWYGGAFDPLRDDCTWMDCTLEHVPAELNRRDSQEVVGGRV
jgi:hypothetical protein